MYVLNQNHRKTYKQLTVETCDKKNVGKEIETLKIGEHKAFRTQKIAGTQTKLTKIKQLLQLPFKQRGCLNCLGSFGEVFGKCLAKFGEFGGRFGEVLGIHFVVFSGELRKVLGRFLEGQNL